MFRLRWLFFGVMCASLLIIAVVKASLAAITWDEAFTYFEFIKTGKLYPGAGGGLAANNHLLNTWISYAYTLIFGISEFSLRFGNIVSLAVYLVVSAWLALRSDQFSVSFLIFAMLNFNPYVFDFFCLSRGYGMAHACLLATVVFLYKFYLSGKASWLKRMIIASLVGMLSGAMLLPAFSIIYFMVFFVLPLIAFNHSSNKKWTKTLQYSLKRLPLYFHLLFVTAIIAGASYLILLQKFNAFLFGGSNGILSDLFFSVIRNSNYQNTYSALFYGVLISLFTILVLVSKIALKNFGRFYASAEGKSAIALMLTIAGTAFSSGVLFVLFSTPLPTERTALFLYLIFASIICLMLLTAESKNILLKSVSLISGIFMLLHFITTFNFKTFHDWRADADAPLMVSDLSKATLIRNDKHIRSIVSLELELPLKFYLEKESQLKKNLSIKRISHPLSLSEVYLLDSNDSGISDSLEKEGGWINITYPQGGVFIYNPVIAK